MYLECVLLKVKFYKGSLSHHIDIQNKGIPDSTTTLLSATISKQFNSEISVVMFEWQIQWRVMMSREKGSLDVRATGQRDTTWSCIHVKNAEAQKRDKSL